MKIISIVLTSGVLLGAVLLGTGFGQQQPQQEGGTSQPMQTLRGGPGDDLIIGTEQRELILGGSGNDVIRGGGGADVIEGGPGNDQIEGETFEELYLEKDD